MSALQKPADILQRVQRVPRDVQRSGLRARNGLKYLAGIDRPGVGLTPKDTVWTHQKLRLWRYRSDAVTQGPPVLIVMSLVTRSYILDLRPGLSFVEWLRDAGFDVFLLDWGVPDEAEAQNTLETYVDEYLPRVVRAVRAESGHPDVHVIGYCFGGDLSLLHVARHPELAIRSLVLMATPVDFDELGFLAEVFKNRRIEVDTIVDETGNVPPDVVRNGFRLLRPTGDLAQYANLWQNLWNDRFLEGYQAMGQWTRDHIPFPGAAARQCVDGLIRDNGLVNGTLRLGGSRVDLDAVRVPVLNVVAEKDHIVPLDSARPVSDLLQATEVEELRPAAGHVALVAGKQAATVTLPGIAAWLRDHSD